MDDAINIDSWINWKAFTFYLLNLKGSDVCLSLFVMFPSFTPVLYYILPIDSILRVHIEEYRDIYPVFV